MKKNIIVWASVLFFVFILLVPVDLANEQTVDGVPYGVHILEDGSVDPADSPISRDGDVYTLTGDITYSIVVEKDNITIEGAGYTLFGKVEQYNGGVTLDYRHGVTVKNLIVRDTYRAFDLTFADDNTIVGNTIINSGRAIYFWWSWRNNVTNNTITRADYAIEFFLSPNYWSQNNIIIKNTVTDSTIGISLMESNNTFTDNTINTSTIGVSISGHRNVFRNNKINSEGISFRDTGFDNDVDESNRVNGKPIIYWIGQQDKTVSEDAAYVFLSNCKNVTAQNLNVKGITLASSTDCMIAGNTINGGRSGIQMIDSSNNTVIGNMVVYNWFGLEITSCENNKIIGNNFSNNSYYGILLTNSYYNTIKQNVVADNGFEKEVESIPFETYSEDIFGVKLLNSGNNLFVENNVTGNNQFGIRVLGTQHDNAIYGNNFIDNKVTGLQVSMLGASANTIANPSRWDNGTVGNYWSDYLTRYPNASEIDGTGRGDTPFYINPTNIDNYPLMEPATIPEFPTWIILPILVTATLSGLVAKKKLASHSKEQG